MNDNTIKKLPALPLWDKEELSCPMPHYFPEDFGAVADGKANDTDAVQKAMDMAENTGGSVILSGEVYLCGQLYLRSKLTLFIKRGSKLFASGSIDDYREDTHYNRHLYEKHMDRCFIYGENCEELVLTGGGVIDGNAPAFHNDLDAYSPRPMLVRLKDCKNIIIEHLSIFDAAAWNFAILGCTDVTARSLVFRSLVNLNGDGLDFDGCRRVSVEDCTFDQSDDSVCLQSNGQGQQDCEDVTIRRCRMRSWTDGVRIGMKSVGDIRRVLIEDCVMEHIWREGVKIESSEGGIIEDIVIRNIRMENVRRPFDYLCNNIIISIGINEHPAFGKIRNITAENITIIDTPEMKQEHYYTWNGLHCVMGNTRFGGIRCDSHESAPLENITFSNLTYCAWGGVKKDDIPSIWPTVADLRTESEAGRVSNYYPDWSRASCMDIRNINGLSLEHISLCVKETDERPTYICENCTFNSKTDIVY